MTDPATMPAGPEMDRLVAELVMQWNETTEDGVLIRGRAMTWGEEPVGRWDEEDNPRAVLVDFHPSSDLAHAWEVVERLEGTGWFLSLGRCTDGSGLAFADHRGWYWDAVYDDAAAHNSGSGLAPTAPLAICRAALLCADASQS